MKKDEIFLKHILENIERIEKKTEDIKKYDFLKSVDIQDIVMRRLGIIGEASRNFSQEFRDRHNEIEWKKIVGLRNVLIHGYFDVDLDLTWEIVVRDLPELKKKIKKIVDESAKRFHS